MQCHTMMCVLCCAVGSFQTDNQLQSNSNATNAILTIKRMSMDFMDKAVDMDGNKTISRLSLDLWWNWLYSFTDLIGTTGSKYLEFIQLLTKAGLLKDDMNMKMNLKMKMKSRYDLNEICANEATKWCSLLTTIYGVDMDRLHGTHDKYVDGSRGGGHGGGGGHGADDSMTINFNESWLTDDADSLFSQVRE